MAKPSIRILSVSRLNVTNEFFEKQYELLYGPPQADLETQQAMKHMREQLESTVLLEVEVLNRDSRFNVSDFTQEIGKLPRDSWQAAWDEVFLNDDGTSLLGRKGSQPPKEGDLRIAFYFHYWDPDKPLLSSYGEIEAPQVTEMSPRLESLVPYEALN